MNILVAPDKFKGSLTAHQVCNAVQKAILEKQPHWNVSLAPLADGGEGTCAILTTASQGKIINCKARDPLFREIESHYGLAHDGKTAFIEMASASGLQLLKENERNPMVTSSIGCGDLVVDAISKGVDHIIIGCGGSATNDGGIGLASALGFSFLDSNGKELKPIGQNLINITSIKNSKAYDFSKTKFTLLTDVDNPLTGPNGAAFIYARQKGATDSDIKKLDEGLKNLSSVLEKLAPGSTIFPGAGAAGGFPVSVKAFLNAELKSGIQFILEFLNIREKISSTDLVITGEGKFDSQSLRGKVIQGLSKLSIAHKKRLWVICGLNEVNEIEARNSGIEKIISISQLNRDIDYSIKNAEALIQEVLKKNLNEFE